MWSPNILNSQLSSIKNKIDIMGKDEKSTLKQKRYAILIAFICTIVMSFFFLFLIGYSTFFESPITILAILGISLICTLIFAFVTRIARYKAKVYFRTAVYLFTLILFTISMGMIINYFAF